MRMKKPAVALATAALMTLAACGGGSGTDTAGSDETVGAGTGKGGEAGSFKNPDAEAPLAVPSDATEGGTLTVLTANVPSTLDPTQAYYTDSTAILSDLVTRSLTQYAYNEETDDMQLIPDMATDLGRPNEDNTEWTFTLRDGLKYEDGTDGQGRGRRLRDQALVRDRGAAGRPDVPDDVLPGRRQVQGSVQGQGRVRRCHHERQRHHHQDASSVHRHGLLRLVPGLHRDSRGEGQPGDLRPAPDGDRSLQVRRLQGGLEPDPGQERELGPEHRPGPHPGRRRLGLQVRPGHRQARERDHQRQRLGADHAHLRQRERGVLPADLGGQGPPDHGHLSLHLHVVHRHDQDQGPQGAPGHRLRVPLRGLLEGHR